MEDRYEWQRRKCEASIRVLEDLTKALAEAREKENPIYAVVASEIALAQMAAIATQELPGAFEGVPVIEVSRDALMPRRIQMLCDGIDPRFIAIAEEMAQKEDDDDR